MNSLSDWLQLPPAESQITLIGMRFGHTEHGGVAGVAWFRNKSS